MKQRDRKIRAHSAHAPATADDVLIIEALRIAKAEVIAGADALERLWPSSPLVERLRVFADEFADLQRRYQQ